MRKKLEGDIGLGVSCISNVFIMFNLLLFMHKNFLQENFFKLKM